MTDLFDRKGQPSFDGLPFPVLGYELRGGMRTHVHEYPHVPGGKPERLGRKLYTVGVMAIFDVSLEARYESNYPTTLNALLAKFERGQVGPLYLPTRGTLRGYADGWTVKMSSAVRSGESADITFMEDSETGYEVDDFFAVPAAGLSAKALTLAELRARYAADTSERDKSLFDQIDDAVNVVRAALDQQDLAQRLVAAKIERLTNLCREAEDRISLLSDPRSYVVMEAMKELWASAVSLGETFAGTKLPIQVFEVPRTMSVQQVSKAIYGDALRASSILDLNYFPDAFAIPVATRVRYYADRV
jgi:prophage DNA circulation protein